MLQTRYCVFETNSSSVHALSICMTDDFKAWKRGDFVFNDNCAFRTDDMFIPIEDAKAYVLKQMGQSDGYEVSKNDLYNHGFDTYDMYTYKRVGEFEGVEETYTTPSGESVTAFGYYGFDG